MLDGWFRNQVSERIHFERLSQRTSTPGSAAAATRTQSNVECVLVRQRENRISAPVTSQNTLYRCYMLEGDIPEVSQVLIRGDGERLTIVTKPETFNGIFYFDAQHTS